MIDLHIHTTASDGVYSPEEIMNMASDLDLEAVSITDHDTMEGVKALDNKDLNNFPELLTGVEISTTPPGEFDLEDSLHLLGYRVDIYDARLNKELELLRQARKNRNPDIIKKLNTSGVDITEESLAEFSGDVQIGRAHIGRYLFEKGYVQNIEEAFNRFIGKGKPAYVSKYKIPVEDAVKAVKAAGGVPVLAHPGLLKKNHQEYAFIFESLKDAGLEGIEVYYPSHNESMRSFFRNECHRLGLIPTGGSDFHGYKNEGLVPGKGRNNLKIPYSVYKSILER